MTDEEAKAAAAAAAASTTATKAKADPLDKSASESRYIRLGGTIVDPVTGQTTGGRTVKRAPLGVEPGYVAPYRGQRVTGADQADAAFGADYSEGIGARYDATDLDLFAGLAPESVAEIQAALIRGGLVSKVPKGIFDDATANAMAKVLAYANKRGLVWQDALDEYVAGGVAGGLGGSGGGRVFTPQLSNPDDLRKTFKQAAFNTTGGNFLDDAAYDRMVAGYQDAEMKAQRAQFDAAGSGATVEDQPTAATFGEDQIKAEDTAGVEAHAFSQYGKVLEGMLGAA